MSSIRFPFATSFLNRSSSTNKDSKIVNAYVEHYSQEQTAIVKRPGLSFHSAGVGCGQGIYSADTGLNDVYSSSDGITWVLETTVNPFTARYGHSAVVFNSKLWVIGGFTGSAPL